MNVFYTHPNPTIAALELDDRRANKLILESAQILVSACHKNNIDNKFWADTANIKPTHLHHPIIIQASISKFYYDWILDYFYALCAVYENSYGKKHGWHDKGEMLFLMGKQIPNGSIHHKIPNCTPYQHLQSTSTAYKLCLLYKWRMLDKRPPRWTNRPIPEWVYSPSLNTKIFSENRFGRGKNKSIPFCCPYFIDDNRRKDWIEEYKEGWYAPLEKLNYAKWDIDAFQCVGNRSFGTQDFRFHTPTHGHANLSLCFDRNRLSQRTL